MSEFTTIVVAALVGGLVGGGALIGLFWNAAENRLRKTFASRESVCLPDGTYRFLTRDDAIGMSQRLDARDADLERKTERNAGLFIQIDDRTGDLEEKVARIEERTTQQWERISEQMAATAANTREATKELKHIAGTVQELALRLERMQAARIESQR